MRSIFRHTKGETILETMIAMTILSLGITMTTTIIASSLRNINASKNRVIAVNIAREGIEAMRNIRDTNWLKYSSKKRDCWNHNPKYSNCPGDTLGETLIKAGDSLIYKEEDYSEWVLQELGFGDDYDEGPNDHAYVTPGNYYTDTTTNTTYYWDVEKTRWEDVRKLFLVDINFEYDSNNDLINNNDTDAYNHIYVANNDALGAEESDGYQPAKTVFKRYITIEYLENNGDNTGTEADNRMRITSTVLWREGKFEFKTDLSTHLTDYLDRNNLN